MGDHTAFFYGTLMAPAVLMRVCHGTNPTTPRPAFDAKPAILHHFRRHRVKNADYPAILPCADGPGGGSACVRGTVVRGLTDGDIWRLDKFEGDEYERRTVPAKLLVPAEGAAKNEDGAASEHVTDMTATERRAAADHVELVEGETVACETYVWVSDREDLEDAEWDFEEFVRGKLWRWAGPEAEKEGEYREVDEAAKAHEGGKDPTGGRGLNGSVERVWSAGKTS
ncbi:hypothetical protein BDY21DRAFT_349645 [Lineolata rhizophorae]|uniref:Putative gamma-glutamylcyclotransferase n=1 Tax=Lineolata rhizophorae TaxID=578093 RepID=A0A6A6NUX6_9PEZI|nr:hypothetical protein BDY21DRAFT_349645 [Lineolata rhizophorae]